MAVCLLINKKGNKRTKKKEKEEETLYYNVLSKVLTGSCSVSLLAFLSTFLPQQHLATSLHVFKRVKYFVSCIS
jgi:hypothetical protein